MSVTSAAPTEAAVNQQPYVVGLGGTLRPKSSSERLLRYALDVAAQHGARTEIFSADSLNLPMYSEDRLRRTDVAIALVEALAQADGVIVSSPGYHGGVSGMVKNALDYVEDLRDHPRPYLDGRAVGCIACAYGWQATTTTLVSLRSTVHALRGWPTPLGVSINSAQPLFDGDGRIIDDRAALSLRAMVGQVLEFIGAKR